VAATSARDAWAVGSDGLGKTLVARWNGTAWKRALSPTPGGSGSLDGVAARSPASAWAVGSADVNTLIVRWNGTAWKQVPSPTPGGFGSLLGVTAPASADAWAVGFECVAHCITESETDAALILHWNGTAWKQSAGG
jgi:hypothetical protein